MSAVYVTLDDAITAIERSGFHVRDTGLLASALARPAAGFAGQEVYETIPAKAAALLESLAKNHPLFDGNKRTAWVLTQLFLWLNGYIHSFAEDEAFELIIAVAEDRLELKASAAAIEAHLEARQPPPAPRPRPIRA